MNTRTFQRLPVLWFATLAVASMSLLAPAAVYAQNVSKTAKVGPYSITFKLLPAESFSHKRGGMVWDAGAPADGKNSPSHPNHHMVAFVKRYGSPMEQAHVSIYYKNLSGGGDWIQLPVVRMHVAGKGLRSTHYGNNVLLTAGKYAAQVTVNNSQPAVFHFAVAR